MSMILDDLRNNGGDDLIDRAADEIEKLEGEAREHEKKLAYEKLLLKSAEAENAALRDRYELVLQRLAAAQAALDAAKEGK